MLERLADGHGRNLTDLGDPLLGRLDLQGLESIQDATRDGCGRCEFVENVEFVSSQHRLSTFQDREAIEVQPTAEAIDEIDRLARLNGRGDDLLKRLAGSSHARHSDVKHVGDLLQGARDVVGLARHVDARRDDGDPVFAARYSRL